MGKLYKFFFDGKIKYRTEKKKTDFSLTCSLSSCLNKPHSYAAAVSKLTGIIASFFHGSLFCLALPGSLTWIMQDL